MNISAELRGFSLAGILENTALIKQTESEWMREMSQVYRAAGNVILERDEEETLASDLQECQHYFILGLQRGRKWEIEQGIERMSKR